MLDAPIVPIPLANQRFNIAALQLRCARPPARCASRTALRAAATAATLYFSAPSPSSRRSLAHIPEQLDAERPKFYMPRNAQPVHPGFPAVPYVALDPSPALFAKFEDDTLFFIFYYQQQTYAQYLAARELRHKGWRYHNEGLTFFKRVGEPDLLTADVERGTQNVFEVNAGWVSRVKRDVVLSRAEFADA